MSLDQHRRSRSQSPEEIRELTLQEQCEVPKDPQEELGDLDKLGLLGKADRQAILSGAVPVTQFLATRNSQPDHGIARSSPEIPIIFSSGYPDSTRIEAREAWWNEKAHEFEDWMQKCLDHFYEDIRISLTKFQRDVSQNSDFLERKMNSEWQGLHQRVDALEIRVGIAHKYIISPAKNKDAHLAEKHVAQTVGLENPPPIDGTTLNLANSSIEQALPETATQNSEKLSEKCLLGKPGTIENQPGVVVIDFTHGGDTEPNTSNETDIVFETSEQLVHPEINVPNTVVQEPDVLGRKSNIPLESSEQPEVVIANSIHDVDIHDDETNNEELHAPSYQQDCSITFSQPIWDEK